MYKTYLVFLVFICTEYKLWGFFPLISAYTGMLSFVLRYINKMLLIFVLVYFDVVIFLIKKVIHSNYVICCNSRKKYFPYIIISIQYFPFIKRPFKINASIKMQLIALFSTGIYKVILL